MGAEAGKPYLTIAGRPILAHTLFAFEHCPLVEEVVLIVSESEVEHAKKLVGEKFEFNKVGRIVAGGLQRQDSVWEGIKSLNSNCELVIVHDGVRPFVTQELLEKSVAETARLGATIVAVPVKDTIKSVSEEGSVSETLDRAKLWAVQTPQSFKYEIVKEAYERAFEDGFYGTDDASLVERLGVAVTVVAGSYENIKITTPEDLALGELILKKRALKR